MALEIIDDFNDFLKKQKDSVTKNTNEEYPSTYSPDMKKWGDAIKQAYQEMKDGKF